MARDPKGTHADLAEPGRIYLVRVTPGARKPDLHVDGGVVHISVAAPAVDGAATAAVQATLARALGVAKTRLTLVRGVTSREKQFRLD